MNTPILFGILTILVASGCLFGGDATNTAEQLAGVRSSFVSDGLLVPSSTPAREQYRDDLLPFRNTINSISGNDGAALKAYLNGSLSLISTVENTEEALRLLGNVNMDAPECGNTSPIMKAIRAMEEAQRDAQQAHEDFVQVQENTAISNTLGADYILNAAQTSDAVAQTHGERIKELKTACGFNV